MAEDERESITDSMDMNLSKLRDIAEDRGAWCAAIHAWGCKESDTTQQLNNSKCCTHAKLFHKQVPLSVFLLILFPPYVIPLSPNFSVYPSFLTPLKWHFLHEAMSPSCNSACLPLLYIVPPLLRQFSHSVIILIYYTRVCFKYCDIHPRRHQQCSLYSIDTQLCLLIPH